MIAKISVTKLSFFPMHSMPSLSFSKLSFSYRPRAPDVNTYLSHIVSLLILITYIILVTCFMTCKQSG